MTQEASRLRSVQRLEARGVRDVKLYLHENAAAHPLSKVKEGVANVLEAYLDGRYVPMRPLNNRVLSMPL